jgi:hypothetical protein
LLVSPFAQLGSPLPDLIDLALQRLDAHADPAPIGLQLRFAGTSRADTAAETRQRNT